MALASAAKRVAAEFEYTGDQIRKAVKEFLKEMGTLRMFHSKAFMSATVNSRLSLFVLLRS
jgi:hypothetical protein